jgi:hypothetical protein
LGDESERAVQEPFMQLPTAVLRYFSNRGGSIMQALAKIAATLGVIGAIVVGSAVPAAAWYGYHHRYYHHHYGYHPYYHRHYYAYHPYYHHHHYRHHWY